MPVHAADPADASAASVSAATIRELLGAGFNTSVPDSRVQAGFQSLPSQLKQDPLVAYAHGLSMLHRGQLDEAVTAFTLAAKVDDYLPAWRALAWTQMLQSDEKAALEHVCGIGLILAQVDAGDVQTDQTESARWAGDFLSAYQQLARSPKNVAEAVQLLDRLNRLFDEELADELQAGVEDFQTRLEELAARTEAVQQQATTRASRRAVQKAEELEESIETAAADAEAAKQLAADLAENHKDAIREIDRRLGRLERDYQFQARQDATIQQEILEVRRQINVATLFSQGGGFTPTSSSPYSGGSAASPGLSGNGGRADAENRLLQLQERLIQLSLARDQLALQGQNAAAQGMQLVQARAVLTSQFNQATSRLAGQQARQNEWAKRLEKQKDDLREEGEPAVTTRTLKSLRTVMPFDLERARKSLEASLDSDAAR